MQDKGDASPDLMSADGVYTRYLTQYPGPGRIIPSHHSLLEVLDFSLGVSKSQMYAKLSMI